jgi:diaminohydroxyphosphoribosylaminopyrimidine deaminase/5-amino-6-(5-phosphoribosylamino)uracil reductase
VTDFLERALALADETLGLAYPKPDVGAVLVRDGEVVGEGTTELRGRHGEIVALDAAGERARGATLYVTMEPCAHHGSTPPCADAIVAAGVARVVAGSRDPNPLAAGGLERLRGAGIEVELADSFRARQQNEAWRTGFLHGRPFVTWKAAVTVDGRSGRSRAALDLRRAEPWRQRTSSARRRSRCRDGHRPRRQPIWLDARDVDALRQPRRPRVRQRPGSPRTRPRAPQWRAAHELRSRRRGRPVADAGEGGPTPASAFLREDLVDKLFVYVALSSPEAAGACSKTSRRRFS